MMACRLQIFYAMGTMPSVGACQAVRWGLSPDLTTQESSSSIAWYFWRGVVYAWTLKDGSHSTDKIPQMAQYVC